MSLAVLARKTRTKQRLKSMNCGNIQNQGRTAGFVLNMTGRGTNGIRTGPKPTAKYTGGGCKGLHGKNCGFGCKGCCEVSCKGGQRHSCCGKKRRVSKECRENCGLCWYQGLSQPAPQMGYGVYLARKSNGAYRPSGRECCDSNRDVNPRRNPNTWKQSPNISAGTIIERKRLAAITCARQRRKFKAVMLGNTCISNKLDAQPPCSYYNTATNTWIQPKESPLIRKCTRTMERVKGRLTYTRINHNVCGTTKAVAQGQSAGDKIALRKSQAFSCQCWNDGSKDVPVAYMKVGKKDASLIDMGGFGFIPSSAGGGGGSFTGQINGAEIIEAHVWARKPVYGGPPTGERRWSFQLLLAAPHSGPPLTAQFITSISVVAQGQRVTTDVKKDPWTDEAGAVFTSTASPEFVQFFKDNVGNEVQVFWTPAIEGTYYYNPAAACPLRRPRPGKPSQKCNRTNRKLFKNPSVRCPSPSSDGYVESLCS